MKLVKATKICSFLFITLAQFTSLNATTIVVNGTDGSVNVDGVCSISEAIIAANTDTASNECPEGSGVDTIELSSDVTLTQQYDNDMTYGRTGTPAISSVLVLDGMGFTIQRNNALSCIITSNSSDVTEFRLLRTIPSSDLTLQNITLTNGCVDGVGAIFASGGALHNRGALSIVNTTFSQNKARTLGGGLFHNAGIISEISNSSFSGNSTIVDGGAISNYATITIIQNTTFNGNSANFAGGAINNSINATLTTIQNNTFSNNSTFKQGGAIYNHTSSTITTIGNTTFVGNSAVGLSSSSGGAIYNNSGVINMLQNSLFHNNGNTECDNDAGTFNGSNNISSNTSGGCPALLATALVASTIGVLADNGGATMTHALLADSEALNQGDGNSTTTDQRGLGLNGVRDIGAFEAQVIELCSSALLIDGFTTTVNNDVELIQAIECSNLNGNNLDTINLGTDIVLTQQYIVDPANGSTGLPPIKTPLTLDGMAFTLQRDDSLLCDINGTNEVGEFRLLVNQVITVATKFSLQNITLKNGCADADGMQVGFSGALLNEGNLSIDTVVFDGNVAGFGGAIANNTGTIEFINNSSFNNNLATFAGGAIHTRSEISLIENTIFYNNSSSFGGAIYLELGTITSIDNSTFSQNSVNIFGGAIYNTSSTISNILNNTFSNNSATIAGSALFNDNNATINNLKNSLFHANGVNECDNSGLISGSNNISDNTSIDCTGVITVSLTTATVAALADNGGATLTHALLAGSEGLGAAIGGTTSDQRGFAADGVRDIGAYEVQFPNVSAPAGVVLESIGVPIDSSTVNFGMATALDPDGTVVSITNNAPAFFNPFNTIVWTATDNHGHQGVGFQIVQVIDSIAPIPQLNGDAVVSVLLGSTYNDLGAIANDIADGEIMPHTTNNPVDTAVLGSYTITYFFTDAGGNSSNITRTVEVQASVGGNVTGLIGDNTVMLSDGNEQIDLSNGGFIFSTWLDSADNYSVSVTTQPTTPSQTCVLSNNSGTITTNNINNIIVTCSIDQFLIGGNISGLIADNTVTLSDGTEQLELSNGSFGFAALIDSGTNYSVSVTTQPTTPSQTCSLTNNFGTVTTANINITVTCAIDQFLIGGMASGLATNNSVTLQLGLEDLIVNTNEAFVFQNTLDDLSHYEININSQPTVPNQTCTLLNPIGDIAGNDIGDVEVNCTTNTYKIGGSVTGLHTGNNLVLQNNGGDDLIINLEGNFDFATELDDSSDYEVTISLQPIDPIQTCTLTNATSSVAGSNVTTIEVNCEFGTDLIYRDGFE